MTDLNVATSIGFFTNARTICQRKSNVVMRATALAHSAAYSLQHKFSLKYTEPPKNAVNQARETMKLLSEIKKHHVMIKCGERNEERKALIFCNQFRHRCLCFFWGFSPFHIPAEVYQHHCGRLIRRAIAA